MMVESARDTYHEAETHRRGNDEVCEDMDGMLDGEDHASTLTRNNEDDRTGA